MQKCFGIVMAVMFGVAAANAADRYVWSGGDESSNFDSWAHAAKTISNALNGASSGDRVIVTNGAYTPADMLTVPSGVTVEGFSGNRDSVVVDCGGTHRGFYLNSGAMLRNLTVSNGFAGGSVYGGGVYSSGATLSNCVICNCIVTNGRGGGVYLEGGDTMLNCLVASNLVTDPSGGGGGVCIDGTGTILRDCVISNNSITGNATNWLYGPGGGNGGGIYQASAGTLTMSNCVVCDNEINTTCYWAGGGGAQFTGRCDIRDCRFIRNHYVVASEGYWCGGGGIRIFASYDCTFVNCDISGNTQSGGYMGCGGIYRYWLDGAATLTLSNCTVNSNSCTVSGGGYGVYVAQGHGVLMNCGFSGNNAAGAGGAAALSAGDRMEGCVISNNVAGGAGGGINVVGAVGITNCTIVGNTAGSGGGASLGGGAQMDSCGISNNVASGAGGGIAVAGPAGITGCGIGHNVASGGGGGLYVGDLAVVSNCTIVGNTDNGPGGGGVMLGGGGGRLLDSTVAYNRTTAYNINGGGILVWDGASVISNVMVLCNTNQNTYNFGGGIDLGVAGALAVDCTIAGNYSVNGAAIRIASGATAVGCTITNHNTPDLSGSVYCSGVLSNCLVAYNTLGHGVVIVVGGRIQGCTIRNNTTTFNGGGAFGYVGGTVFFNGNAGLVKDCMVASNNVAGNGGGLYFADGSAYNTAMNCRVTGNIAGLRGGGVDFYYSCHDNVVRDCLIDGNQAGPYGGGVCMHLANGVMGGRVENCTIVRNYCSWWDSQGGGIAMADDSSWYNVGHGVGVFTNCVVACNKSGSGASPCNDIYPLSPAQFGYCCSTNELAAGNGNVIADPKFMDAGAGYGASGYVAGNYRLKHWSPCINTGLDDMSWMTNAVDLDGNPRIMGSHVDMGAYETFPPPKGATITFF